MLSVFDNGPTAPCPTPFNLAGYVLAAGANTPDKIALQILGLTPQSLTFAEITAAIRGCGTGLLALGLTPGDRILMRLGNTVEFPILFLGAIAAGLVPVPTSAQLTAPEITTLAQIIAPQLVVADPGIAIPYHDCPILPGADLHAMAHLPPCDLAMGDPDRLAYIVFTSGTSGRPQAVMHAHRAIWARRMMHQGWYGLTADDRLLHAGALNWTFTLGTGLLDPWTLGATALVPDGSITPLELGSHLAQSNATILAAAPGVIRQMLKSPLPALPALRHGLCAGETLAPPLRTAWQSATGTDLHEALGMSECSTFISGAPSRPAPPGSTGYPQPGRRIAILGDTGPAEINTPGTLAIATRDPGLFLGYLDDPAATGARIRGEWFLTGDTAQMAADGAITYLGRDGDLMNAGGYRTSPLEIEATLGQHPDITDCAVAEVSPKPGITIIACFYTAPAAIDPLTLSAFAAARLARYKQPRAFIHVAALPRGPNNKLIRRALGALYRTEGT